MPYILHTFSRVPSSFQDSKKELIISWLLSTTADISKCLRKKKEKKSKMSFQILSQMWFFRTLYFNAISQKKLLSKYYIILNPQYMIIFSDNYVYYYTQIIHFLKKTTLCEYQLSCTQLHVQQVAVCSSQQHYGGESWYKKKLQFFYNLTH